MAQYDGYRSRVGYKLLEIQKKDRILHPGMTVVDLGITPGGWSQVTGRVIGDRGRLIASGILEMNSIPDVTFTQGDLTEDMVFVRILKAISDHPVDLVTSGMASNMNGVWAIDQPRVMYLCELALNLVGHVLRPGGDPLIKIFRGEGLDQYHKQVRGMFDKVQIRRPLSSRDCSREQYLLVRGFRGGQTGVIDPMTCLLVDDLLCRDERGFIKGYRQRLRARASVQYLWPEGVWPSCEAVFRTEPASGGSQLNDMARNLVLWLIIMAVLVTVMDNFSSPSEPQTLNYPDFTRQVKGDKVERVTVDGYVITGERNDSDTFKTIRPAIQDGGLIGGLVNNNVVVEGKQPEQQSIWTQLLVASFPTLMITVVFIFFIRQMQDGGGSRNGPMNFDESKARPLSGDQVKTTFADVAGCDEAKEEVSELVELLRNPGKFQCLGGHIPRGVLMAGPPGIGKTLLVKAIAGEVKVPFSTISGSDFVEMFVSMSVSRVRGIFDQAKKHAPYIIFTDEVDAIGRHRGVGLDGGHDKREQTLNQLLVEMDSFETNDGAIVITATNHPDILGPALLYPGRSDHQVVVGSPDIREREQIFKVHMRKAPPGDRVDPTVIARGMPGFSGADLASLVNETSLFAARSSKRTVDMREFGLAKDKIVMGARRGTMVMSEREKRNTAHHETNHAIVGRLVPKHDPVYKVSIIPRRHVLGITVFLPEKGRYSLSKRAPESQICSLFGDHITEEMTLDFEGVATGTPNDIMRATRLAWNMMTKWGLSEKLDPLMYVEEGGEMSLGRSAGSQHANVSGETVKMVNQEVRYIIDDRYGTTERLLDGSHDKPKMMADALMKYGTIDSDQIGDVMIGCAPRKPRDWQSGSGIGTSSANLEESGRCENTPPIGGPVGEY